MHAMFKTVLALAFVASLPLPVRAIPGTSPAPALSAKEVSKAEAKAKTAEDHLRLAAFYQSKAQQAHSKLAEAEDMMKHYSWMADRSKEPNAYTSSRSLADRYRAEYEQSSKLAADHRRVAQSLQASAGGSSR